MGYLTERSVGRDQGFDPPVEGDGGKHRVKGAESRIALEQGQARIEILGARRQRREGSHVVAGVGDGIRARSPTRSHVQELLYDLDCGRGLDASITMGPQHPPAWLAQRVLRAYAVAEHGGIQQDHPCNQAWAASSSRRSSAGSAGT